MSNRYFVPLAFGLSFLTLSTNATAQLIPDNTLGPENSLITPLDLLNDRIDGGASRGINLFHSFLEFNVGNGRGVYFANPVGIENILTRVTGTNASDIFGTLGVLGNANLFLINPNGIYFGPNARLEVSGSFLASTADGIQLGSSGYFSATDPQGSQLLSVESGALFSNALRNYQAEINNQGNLAVGGDLTLDADKLNLQGQLQAGGDLTLQATDTVQIRDSATNPFIASAAGDLLVQGNQNVDIFALNHPHSGLYSGGEMVLKSPNSVIGDAHYYSGGNFRIETLDGNLGNLTSPNDPIIRAAGDVSFTNYTGTSLHIFAGGSVTISGTITITGPDPINGIVENVPLSNGNTLAINGRTQPTLDIRAGTTDFGLPLGCTGCPPMPTALIQGAVPTSADITINQINFEDTAAAANGLVFLSTQFNPNLALPGGNIQVGAITTENTASDAGSVIIDSRAGINLTGDLDASSDNQGGQVTLLAQGDLQTASINTSGGNLGGGGGNIRIRTNGNAFFDGSNINSNTLGIEKAGDISIEASSVELTNGAQLNTSTRGAGNGGDININVTTESLIMSNGARLDAGINGNGNGGSITILARDTVSLDGVGNNGLPTAALTNVEPNATGDAGNVRIEARSLSVTNGALLESRTRGQGDAANIEIVVREQVNFSGSNNGWNSGAYTSVERGAVGNGGNINIIDAGSISLTNDARLTASTLGLGDAGNVNLNARDTVSLNASRVFSTVGASGVGNGGNINIIDAGSISLTNGASLSATTGGQGDAGNVNLNARGAVSLNNSRVFSRVVRGAVGNGGNIDIDAGSISLTNDARLTTSTLGEGDAGNVNLSARGTVSLNASRVFSTVEVGAVGNGGDINIIDTGSVSLSDGASLSATTGGQGKAGNVYIDARDAVSLNNSRVFSRVARGAVGRGGDVTIIDADSVSLTNGAVFSASTSGQGNAGNVNINARDTISLDGVNSDGVPSAVFSRVEASGVGNGGNVDIDAGSVSLTNGAGLTAATRGQGDAGNVNINARDTVSLNASRVFSTVTSSGVGNGGNIHIDAGSISLTNGAGLFASTGGQGNAGNLTLDAEQLSVQDGASVSAATSSAGNGGNLEIITRQLIVQSGGEVSANTTSTGRAGTLNVNASELVEITGAADDPSRLFFDSTNSGDAGELRINTRRLTIGNGGRISAATSGAGRGGILDLNATDSIEISGAGGVFFDSRGAGNARGIQMNTGSLVVTDGGQVTVSGTGTGVSGDLEVNANSVFLNNHGSLRATTRASEGGNIQLRVTDSVELFNNSEISAEAFGRANGGNITFEVGGIIFAILSENSDVVANAFEGNGGEITGSATAVLGFRQFEKVRTPESDFTADSALGFDGIVDIDEQNRQLPKLPLDFLNIEDLNQDVCAIQDGKIAGGSSFVVTGRGGLPIDPAEGLPSLGVIVEWASREGDVERNENTGRGGFSEQSLEQNNNLAPNPAPTTVILRERSPEESDEIGHPQEIRPAQGWIIQSDGTVLLTAEVPTPSTYNQGIDHPDCHAVSQR